MARLINEKGTWYIQIHKDNPKELYSLLSNLNGFYMETYKEEASVFIFNLYDSCQGDVYTISKDDYLSILSKITDLPEPELVIPYEREAPPCFSNSFFEELNRPNALTTDFLNKLGLDNSNDTNFKWEQ